MILNKYIIRMKRSANYWCITRSLWLLRKVHLVEEMKQSPNFQRATNKFHVPAESYVHLHQKAEWHLWYIEKVGMFWFCLFGSCHFNMRWHVELLGCELSVYVYSVTNQWVAANDQVVMPLIWLTKEPGKETV